MTWPESRKARRTCECSMHRSQTPRARTFASPALDGSAQCDRYPDPGAAQAPAADRVSQSANGRIRWQQVNAIAAQSSSRSTRISRMSSCATARYVAGPPEATGSRWSWFQRNNSAGSGASSTSRRGRSRTPTGRRGSAASAAHRCQVRTTRPGCSRRQVPLPREVTRSRSFTTSGWAQRPSGTKLVTRGCNTPRNFVADIAVARRPQAPAQITALSGPGGKVVRWPGAPRVLPGAPRR